MLILNLVLAFLLQTPATGEKVVVGLGDGQQVVVQDPEFTGFIEGRNGDAVLLYRQQNFHGEMPIKNLARIDFRPYKKGRSFPMTLKLRNGQTLEVISERRDFVKLKGKTDFGTVTITHPDPISAPLHLTTRKTNRKKDLTIQYLEIPAP